MKLLNIVLQNMVKLLDLVLHNMLELLNLVLQNKSVECKSQTPSTDPKDLWVLFLIEFKIEISIQLHSGLNTTLMTAMI